MLQTLWELPLLTWLALGATVYLLVTCILNVLAAEVRREVERHDLVVRSIKQRYSYRNSIRKAKERVNNAHQNHGGADAAANPAPAEAPRKAA